MGKFFCHWSNGPISGAASCVCLIFLFGLFAEAMFLRPIIWRWLNCVTWHIFRFISRMRIPAQTCHEFRLKVYHFSAQFRNRWESSTSQHSQYNTYYTCHRTGLLFLTTLVTRVTTLIYRYYTGFEIIPQSNRIFHPKHPGTTLMTRVIIVNYSSALGQLARGRAKLSIWLQWVKVHKTGVFRSYIVLFEP